MSANDAKYYYNKGTIYSGEGKYGLAIDNFKTALSIDPDSVEINFNLGVAYINKKEYSLAIECFKTVLKHSPDEVAAFSNIALAYAKNNAFNLAIDNYKKVLEFNPDDTPTFKDLGDVYTKNKQYDNAIECYNTFLKAHPTSFLVKESLNTAINLQKNQLATKIEAAAPIINKDAENTLKEDNKSAQEYFDFAVNCVKEQKFDSAIENLRKCLKINSDYPNAYELLNKLFKIKEKFNNNAPVKQLENIEIPKPQLFVDYRKFNEFFTLGVAYYNAQNYNMALENFKKGIEINPADKDCNDYISKITLN